MRLEPIWQNRLYRLAMGHGGGFALLRQVLNDHCRHEISRDERNAIVACVDAGDGEAAALVAFEMARMRALV